MRKILGLILSSICLAMCTKHTDCIIIEHIGIGDKPIFKILICKEGIDQIESKRYIVSNVVFSKIKKIVENNAKDNIKNENIEFGSFKLTIKIDNKDLNYFFERKNSIQLFDQMAIELMKYDKDKDVDLIMALENLKKRIIF